MARVLASVAALSAQQRAASEVPEPRFQHKQTVAGEDRTPNLRIMRPTRCQLRYWRLASEVASASASFKGKRLRAVFGRVLSGRFRAVVCEWWGAQKLRLPKVECDAFAAFAEASVPPGQVYVGRTRAFWGCAPEPVRSRRGVARRKAGDRRRGCVATSRVLLCGLLQLVQWGPCCRCRALRYANQHFAASLRRRLSGCRARSLVRVCGELRKVSATGTRTRVRL